ncbi:MAG: C25 family cysteine peptidase, partial [Lentisphaeria bacterium]
HNTNHQKVDSNKNPLTYIKSDCSTQNKINNNPIKKNYLPKKSKNFTLIASNHNSSSATFSLPADSYSLITEHYNNKNYSKIQATNSFFTNSFNRPILPFFVQYFLVPNNCEPSLITNHTSSQRIKIDFPPQLAYGDYPRNSPLPKIDHSYYFQNEIWPSESIILGKVMDFRGKKLLPVIVYPFAYDSKNNELIVRDNYQFTINTTSNELLMNSLETYPEFSEILNSMAINYQPAVDEYIQQTRSLIPASTSGHILLLFPEKFSLTVEPFVAWKRKIGFTVSTTKVGVDVENSVAAIESFIKNQIQNGVTHIIICGDREDIPSRFYFGNQSSFTTSDSFTYTNYNKLNSDGNNNTYSDLCYVGINPSSNKLIADAFISRFPTTRASYLAAQLDRVINYENSTIFSNDTHSTWMDTLTSVASHEGGYGSYNNKTDYQHLADQVKKLSTAQNCEFDNFVEIYDLYSKQNSTAPLLSAFSNGTGITYYLGHGSKNSWSVTGLTSSHFSTITNSRPGVSIQPVCLTGAFWDSCMSEEQLRTGKFVGVYAATSNTYWNPPMVFLEKFTNSLISNNYDTIGGYIHASMTSTLSTSVSDVNNYVRALTALQLHYFGDCSMGIRTKRLKNSSFQTSNLAVANSPLNITATGENPQARTSFTIAGNSYHSSYSNPNHNDFSIISPSQEGFYNITSWSRNSSPSEKTIQIGTPILINPNNFCSNEPLLDLNIFLNGNDFSISNPNFYIDNGVIFAADYQSLTLPLTIEIEYYDPENALKTTSITFDHDNSNDSFYSLNLYQGWNLVGSPVNTSITSNEIFLHTPPLYFLDHFSLDYEERYNSTLNAEEGFWLFANENTISKSFQGALPSSTLLNLNRGWNLISPAKYIKTPLGVTVWR